MPCRISSRLDVRRGRRCTGKNAYATTAAIGRAIPLDGPRDWIAAWVANGLHAAAGVGEETGDVLATVGQARDGVGGNGLLLTRCGLHSVIVSGGRGGARVFPCD